MSKVKINPAFESESLSNFIAGLPQSFDSRGKELYRGRNTVKAIRIGEVEMIVKRFRHYKLWRALLNIGRPSKADRAFRYGLEFLRRGIQTPMPVAMIEKRRCGLLRDTWFISLPSYAPSMIAIRTPDFDVHEVALLSRFLHHVHEQGILHGDLNLTNILLTDATASDPLRRYTLIDTNRSRILRAGHKATAAQRARNLMRVTHRRDLLRAILRAWPGGLPSRTVFSRLLAWERRKKILHTLFPH